MSVSLTIGILGLQGCFEPQKRKLTTLGCTSARIVYPGDLEQCQGLIMPGGESTTMLKAMTDGLWEALQEFGQARPVWGICAGSILIAKSVTQPEQQSLGLMNTTVVRNAYGAQNESFITELDVDINGEMVSEEAVFIRAPVIRDVGRDCTVMASHDGNPVVVRNTLHLATTFHPELTESLQLHRYFLAMVEQTASHQ